MLLYADDTIILAENERDLQAALDSVQEYCTKFKLIVNINKTKIIIFSRGKVRRFTTFKYGCDIIEVVSDYVYLGVKMNFNNTFAKAMKKQLDQGRRAQFSMLIKARNLDLPIDIQTKLFESIVCPILLYGSEVWGFQKIDMLEIFYIKFFKKILKLRPSTPNCMIYGEVGKLPLQTSVDKQLIAYWLRVLNKDVHTFAYMVYMIELKLFRRDEYKSQWLKRVKYILDSCGLSYMWYQQQQLSTKQCKVIIHQRIEDIALQKWNTDISTSSMCKMYRIFKKQLDFENYLLHSNYRDRISLSKLRCANSKLPIYKHIYSHDSDVCTLCNLNVCGDEYHYVLICPFLKHSRTMYLKPYFYTRPSLYKLGKLFCSSSKKTISNLSKFSNIIFNQF